MFNIKKKKEKNRKICCRQNNFTKLDELADNSSFIINTSTKTEVDSDIEEFCNFDITYQNQQKEGINQNFNSHHCNNQFDIDLISASIMPSKEMNDVLAVEELVHEIKENLRLKARPSHTHGRNSRPSPYHIPCSNMNCSYSSSNNNTNSDNNLSNNSTMSGCGTTNNLLNTNICNNITTTIHNHNSNFSSSTCTCNRNHHHNHHKKSQNNVDDIDDPYELLQALLKNQNLVKEAVRRLQLNISPKQRYFYESDDDGSRSPSIYRGRVCQLEL